MSLTSTHLAFLTITLAGLGSVAAQPVPSEPAPLRPRVGFEFGAGLYGGEINCEDQSGDFCDGVTEAGGFDLHATYMFAPSIGITLDVWPMFHREDAWTFTHTVATVGAKWRPAPIISLTAGLGSAQARLRYDGPLGVESERETETAPAIFLSAGLDLVRGRHFALGVEARVGAGFYGEDRDDDGNPDIVGRNVGLGAAISFF